MRTPLNRSLSRLALAIALIGHSPIARSEMIYGGVSGAAKSENKKWDLLRGNVDFKWAHPLKVFHGRVNVAHGTVGLNPDDFKNGVVLKVAGQRNKITFEESAGSLLLAQLRDVPWSYTSFAMDWFGLGEGGTNMVNMVGYFMSGASKHPLSILAACQPDPNTLRCTLSGQHDLARWEWPIPRLLWIPMDSKLTFSGELVFGSAKEGDS